MWVLGWGSRRPLWSRRRAAEDPQWSKAPQTHPCSQYFMGQCWITKTCHHETPDLDWGLLQSTVRSTFELPRPSSIHFFPTCCVEKVERRKWSEIMSALTTPPPPKKKMMQWSPWWVLYSQPNTPPVLFICFIWQVEQRWQMHRTKQRIHESERIWHDDRRQERLEAFFPLSWVVLPVTRILNVGHFKTWKAGLLLSYHGRKSSTWLEFLVGILHILLFSTVMV